ncbi:MAG: hypothetical protein H6744_06000 [Deltaproteobacteria bacterium]|nr:hypothetical protein [Deltaproteobacteria bacterium]MCB9786231.1 hypothetical protein [Deltaproteobacteria bacterium]
MPELDAARLRQLVAAFIRPAGLRLEGLSEGPDGFRLGGFVLAADAPRFTGPGGQSGALGRASWFRREAFSLPGDEAPALAAILHVADRGADGEPDERLVGWVPASAEADLARWLARLNGELVERLEAERDHAAEGAEFFELEPGPDLPSLEPAPRRTGPRLRLVEPPE